MKYIFEMENIFSFNHHIPKYFQYVFQGQENTFPILQ